MGVRVPFAVSRFARKARYFGMGGERGCCGNWFPPEITLGVLAPFLPRATLFLAVSGRGGIPHWR